MLSLDPTLAPLESLAADRLRASDAPCANPTTRQELRDLRRWAMDRCYHDRVAAGVAMGCSSLRDHCQRQQDGYRISTEGIVKQTANLAEWGAALRLLSSGADVSFARIEEIAPQVAAALRADEQRRGAASSGGQSGRKVDASDVCSLCDDLIAAGKNRRDVASLISKRLPIGTKRVRDILKENGK